MWLTSVAAAALPLMGAANLVDSVLVTVTTGADDLRGDSSALVAIETTRGRKTTGLAGNGNGLAARTPRTVTIKPPPNTNLEDLQQVLVNFHSGKATGFDDHWIFDQVKVEAVVNGRTRTVYTSGGPPTKLMFTQEWRSPFFPTAVSPITIQASNFWAEVDYGAEGARRLSEFRLDFDLEDGRGFEGEKAVGRMDDLDVPGVTARSLATEHFPIHAIRQVRLGFTGRSEQFGDVARSLEAPDNCEVRHIRLYYRRQWGERLLFATFPEVNHRFPEKGWWQSPRFRPFKREAGTLVGAMKVEVINGRDDLRRAELNPAQSQHFNSYFDLWFNVPLVKDFARLPWLMKSEWSRGTMERRPSIPIQDRDGFPDRWTGRHSAYGRLTKISVVEGEPFLLPSDLFGVSVQFYQGQGGNLAGAGTVQNDGLINALRQPDNWDFAGLIVSTAPNENGPWRRVYSDLAINEHMSRDRQQWRSRQFEGALIRPPPR